MAKFTNQYGYTRPLTIIMDNSIVELGGAVDDAMIESAVNIVRSQGSFVRHHVIPVLPDVMGDGRATFKMSSDAYDRWTEQGMPGDGFMYVTHGRNFAEFATAIDMLFIRQKWHFRKITWVGIPRALLHNGVSRSQAVEYIRTVAPWVKIHLLGFSDFIWADMQAANLPGVHGIDSAVPVRYDDLMTPSTTAEQIGKRGDWWEKGVLTNVHIENIKNVRQWIGQNG